jgi:hypothetical protein
MILPGPHQELGMEHLPTPHPDAADSARRLGQRGETSGSSGTKDALTKRSRQVVEPPRAQGPDDRRLHDEEVPP